jgi:tripartite-type tricarboxylate transporter receptor subunit TctC
VTLLRWAFIGIVAAAACLLETRRPAVADAAADFRGKTVTVYIGYGPGGGYDFYARMIAKYLPKHLPGNPTVLAVNKPGASSMVLANFLAKVAPRDGTAIGAVNSALVFDPLFSGSKSSAQFNGPDLTMIGNAVSSASVLVALTSTGIKSIEDLKTKRLIVAATSRSGDTYVLPLAIKRVLGLDQMEIITGYPGTNEAALALERGEVTGRVWDMEGIKVGRPQWLKDGTIQILGQLAEKKMPEVPANVPLVRDFVKDAKQRAALDVIFLSTTLARPYIAPPELPAERAKALRDAFMRVMADPDFLADMKRQSLTVDPTSGPEMQRAIANAYALPPDVIELVRKILAD